jgi:phage-related protein
MVQSSPRLSVVFYKTPLGREPVREWLMSLPREERRTVGEDLNTVQFGWPLGMPLVRPLGDGLWEVRVQLATRIARIFFVTGEGLMVLLHAFVKKSQQTPQSELDLAKLRATDVRQKRTS